VTRQRADAVAQLQAAPLGAAPPQETADHDEIRAISVFEHPDLLNDALTGAKRRILLISPWIKKAIITTDFLGKLEGRLRAKVAVDIAYGYSDETAESDPEAVRRLQNLAARYPEYFHLTRLKSTHAKVLLFDDVWITTSFNWLSFKGDRRMAFRSEEGTLVRGRSCADERYQRYRDQIEAERA
jgi:phosphatidylserine/phosphatidylglycerophosphate/cardiolipin synthase-like enzyme